MKKPAKKLTKKQWHELMWNKAFDVQFETIKEKLGKKRAENANYGWGDASDGAGRVDIATKVYGDPCEILCTKATYPSLEFEHEWEEYG